MAIHFLQWPLNLPLDFTRHSPSPLAKRAFPLPPDARLIINRCITFMAISLPTHLPSSLSSLSVRAISLVLSLPSTAASLLWRFHSCSNSLPGRREPIIAPKAVTCTRSHEPEGALPSLHELENLPCRSSPEFSQGDCGKRNRGVAISFHTNSHGFCLLGRPR